MEDTPPQDPQDQGLGADEVLMPGLDIPETENAAAYQVLARKYRPSRFEDLIGQEAMVRTLTNAFAAGRIAHAYMLTGVRGIGKTTTARLIARALNYQTDAVDAPSMRLDPPGQHCDAIARSTHVDVMEMDAASRTGVGDIREILDGVRYAPVSGRYKVYIIDEVHMLSSSAFNALLKTLEEPPSHAKFIFATTEIRKVPVTVLSRCQRFDLKRVDREMLTDHLERICGLEKAQVERDGLSLIARAAEGSVRDALSLLDQAIVQGADQNEAVSAAQIREMLGLADRARVLDLLEHAVAAKAGEALDELGSLYDAGGDPLVITRDLLDYVHAASRVKAAGPDVDLGEAAETKARIASLADQMSLAQLTRLWKLLLSGLEDVRAAPDPLAAAEMTLLRLTAAMSLPPPEEAARVLAGGAPGAAPASASAPAAVEAPGKPEATASDGAEAASPAAKSAEAVARPRTPTAPQPEIEPAPGQTAPSAADDTVIPPDPPPYEEAAPAPVELPQDFESLIGFIAERRSIEIQMDVERFVRPVSCKPGQLTFEPAQGAPIDLAPRLSKKLKEWTGTTWMVLCDPDARGGETWNEKKRLAKREAMEAAERDPAVARALMMFPGAELVAISPPEAGASAAPREDKEKKA